MNMSPLGNISQTNARAVFFMTQGDYGGAKALLNEALESIKACFIGTDRQELCTEGNSAKESNVQVLEEVADIYIESVPVPVGPASTLISTTSGNSTPGYEISSEVFTLFSRGLVTSPVYQSDEEEGTPVPSFRVLQQRMAAVVLYNMALLHSLRGMQKNNSQDLKTSLELYRMTMGAISNHSDGTCVTDADTVLVLAVLNNMGYLHEVAFVNHKEACSCFVLIQTIFGSLQEPSVVLSDEESLFFYMKLFLFPQYSKPTAPAA